MYFLFVSVGFFVWIAVMFGVLSCAIDVIEYVFFPKNWGKNMWPILKGEMIDNIKPNPLSTLLNLSVLFAAIFIPTLILMIFKHGIDVGFFVVITHIVLSFFILVLANKNWNEYEKKIEGRCYG